TSATAWGHAGRRWLQLANEVTARSHARKWLCAAIEERWQWGSGERCRQQSYRCGARRVFQRHHEAGSRLREDSHPGQINKELATAPKKVGTVLAAAPLAGALGTAGLAGAGQAAEMLQYKALTSPTIAALAGLAPKAA